MELANTAHYERVRAMMMGFEQDCPECPTIPDGATRLLRARLIMEEALELITEGLAVNIVDLWQSGFLKFEGLHFALADRQLNLVQVVDGCVDLSVVNTGTLVAFGVPDKPFLEEVDSNNLEKIAKGRKDEHGKFIKHPDHQPPNIRGLLEQINKDCVPLEGECTPFRSKS